MPLRKTSMNGAPKKVREPKTGLRVIELFAGVGGFHIGLARAGMRVIWANQWEPGIKKQHAFECYWHHFGTKTACVNKDIEKVLDEHMAGSLDPVLPDHDLLVGGFPCQDYSVAKPLSQATGIHGKKGVLWWQIERLLYLKRPSYIFLENVDRLLKSPISRRGRDFAVMLSCLARLGYEVEWRVINAADYGFPQKRRRVYIVGRHERVISTQEPVDSMKWLLKNGIIAKAFPAGPKAGFAATLLGDSAPTLRLHPREPLDPGAVSRDFRVRSVYTPFKNAGLMRGGEVWTLDVASNFTGRREVLRDWLQPEAEVPRTYFVQSRAELAKWKHLKGPKREKRCDKKTGFEYFYAEGGIPFPDPVDRPARTVLTGEGGSTPSRFKHLIDPTGKKRPRRLTPIELERINGFPDDWTNTGMPEGRRAFCMGNALVVGVVEAIGRELARRASLDRAALRRSSRPLARRG